VGLSYVTVRLVAYSFGIEHTVRRETGSAVPGCFPRELYAGNESEPSDGCSRQPRQKIRIQVLFV